MKPTSGDAANPNAFAEVQDKICPDCGASYKPGDATCWMCQRDLINKAKRDPYAPSPRPSAAQQTQFSLSSLMLMITLAAVLLGVGVNWPGWSVVLLFIVVPALIRTFTLSRRSQDRGRPLTPAAKVVGFGASFGLIVMIGLAGFAAFFSMCYSSVIAVLMLANRDRQMDTGNSLSELFMTILAIVLTVLTVALPILLMLYLARKTWPKR